jgi:Holliday junction resolvase
MVNVRDKGKRGEYGALKALKELGLNGYRVPLSGAHPHFKGDLLLDNGTKIEVKVRENGFVQLYSWLENVDALMVRQTPYGEWLMVIPICNIERVFSG